jgi:N6-adenosine-specific RNA methylase IME4
MSPFASLGGQHFDFIMADPPWSYKNYSRKGEHKGAAAQYTCMELADIKALPVAELAAPDCLLMLWATNPLLDRAFEVMAAWDFTFKTAGHWAKYTPGGKQAFGTGYLLRAAGEPFLIGTRGRPQVTRACRSVINGVVRGHSRKPVEAYEWAEELMPHARRIEVFARQSRPGWTTWGDEATKFDEPEDIFA